MSNSVKLTVVAVIIGLGYWATLPPHDLALDSQCQLTDSQARLSEAFYGHAFWVAQQQAVDREYQLLQTMISTADGTEGSLKSTMNPIESRMSRLSNGDPSRDVQDQPAVAERIQQERFAQLGHLTVCRTEIAKHLSP